MASSEWIPPGSTIIVSPPLGDSGKRTALVLQRILEKAGFSTCLIGDEEIPMGCESTALSYLRKKLILNDLFICGRILRNRKRISLAIYHIGAPSLTFSLVLSRVLGIGPIVLIAGSESKSAFEIYGWKYGRLIASIMSRYFSIREKVAYSTARRLIIYTTSLIGDLGVGKWKSKCVVTGPLAIETEVFRPLTLFENRPDVIGFIGRLSEEKGPRLFLDSLSEIFRKRERTRAIIVGAGPLEDELRALARERGLSGRVEFTGWVDSGSVATYLNQMRLCVVPSRTEGMPLLIVQAMACGTPVLASRVGGIEETLAGGNLGFLLDVLTKEHLAERVINILARNDLREFSERIATHAAYEFSLEAVAMKYRNALLNLGIP